MNTTAIITDISILESIMMNNQAIEKTLVGTFGFSSPRGASQSALESDCCGCNNEPV